MFLFKFWRWNERFFFAPAAYFPSVTDLRAGLSPDLKGGWTAALRVELTASPFSLTRGKQMLEGESIFISSPADGSRIDIKGDFARGKEGVWEKQEWGLGGRVDNRSRSKEQSKKIWVRDWEIIGRRQALRMKRAKCFRWSETWNQEGRRSSDGRRGQKLRIYK